MRELVLVDGELLIYAFRYALGRMTYAPTIVIKNIKSNIDSISDKDIEFYIREIEECSNYGMEYDKTTWINLMVFLKKELIKRKIKKRI